MDWHKTIRVEFDGEGKNEKFTELRFKWNHVAPLVWPNPFNPDKWTTILVAGAILVIVENIDDVCRQIDESLDKEKAEQKKEHLADQIPHLAMGSKILQFMKEHHGE